MLAKRRHLIIIGSILVVAVDTYEVAILQVVELGRDGLAAWTTALKALIVIEDLVGEFLVGLTGCKDLRTLEAFWCRLGITSFADKGAILFLKELLTADGLVAFDAAQTLRVVILVLIRGNRRGCYDGTIARVTVVLHS